LYWSGRNNELENLKTDVANLTSEIVIKDAQYKSNIGKLKNEIIEQNESIVVLNKQYKTLEDVAKIEITKTNAINDAKVKNLNDKLKLIDGIDTPKTCQSAIDLLVDIGMKNKWDEL
jgi:hypothetical protein